MKLTPEQQKQLLDAGVSLTGQRGRPATPYCPVCVKEGIHPPRLRSQPGWPCIPHKKAKQNEYQKAWSKKQRRKARYKQLAEDLVRWVGQGQVELAYYKISAEMYEIEKVDLAGPNELPELTEQQAKMLRDIRIFYGDVPHQTYDEMAENPPN